VTNALAYCDENNEKGFIYLTTGSGFTKS
jgi:hypothetical protein